MKIYLVLIWILIGISFGQAKGTDFRLSSGYTVRLDERGLSRVSLNGILLGSGEVSIIDGGWFFKSYTPDPWYIAVSSRSVRRTNNGAIVTHTHNSPSLAAVYTYTVSGDDIHVSVSVKNDSSIVFQPAFRSVEFLNDSINSSWAVGLDYTYTQSHGELLAYPSSDTPLAAGFLTGAVGSTPLNWSVWSEDHPSKKFFTMSTWQNDISAFFFERIPPGGTRTYKYAYRFSASTDWKVLLSTYKKKVREFLPSLKYEPDARPFAFFTSIDQSWIRSDNPYGYNDGGTGIVRRFDKLEGVQDFVNRLIGPMLSTGYQGILLWQPQGINPRGIQYRPDFDIFPPEFSLNVPTLISGFNNVGLKIGLLARPGVSVIPLDATSDTLVRVTNTPAFIAEIQGRIKHAASMGFNGYYLDSFIADGDDHIILNAIRSVAGKQHAFTEFPTVLSMASAGVYQEMYWDGSKLQGDRDMLRWIWPEAITVVQFRGALPPGGYAQLYQLMFEQKLTPLIEDYRAWDTSPTGENAILKPLVAAHIGANVRWL